MGAFILFGGVVLLGGLAGLLALLGPDRTADALAARHGSRRARRGDYPPFRAQHRPRSHRRRAGTLTHPPAGPGRAGAGAAVLLRGGPAADAPSRPFREPTPVRVFPAADGRPPVPAARTGGLYGVPALRAAAPEPGPVPPRPRATPTTVRSAVPH
ncbi:hypothetical protein GCM10010123_23720 [Pilimelia anulata]|uniref:Uncharacterized protein n=1 Tax=Pilimelia anulata TaxID=53371 RepID=A0A8J3B796_9ACTN|nr:hypothetical protein [Pilimelia anulata]GGJ93124.1 hypothetical protein GCM10010123_23720 [Pilimelia anulata]